MASKITMNRGTTFAIDVDYQVDGEPATLVGGVVRFTVKSTEYDSDADDSDAILVKNVSDGDAQGHATISIDPVDTATITPGNYYYDIKVENADHDIYKIAEGRFKLDGSPTNRQD